MLREAQDAVQKFHEAFGIKVGDACAPKIVDKELRKNLIREEFEEMMAALEYNDLIGAIDGGCDLIYVVLGSFVTWGVPLSPFFEAVHQANMAKIGGHRREDGKWVKPEGWVAPDLAAILERQITDVTHLPRD